MAGRGRGRGRGMSFNVENLGFSKGESLPGPLLQPPPLFPPLDYKPMPLEVGEEWDYMLALKQEFRGSMKDSPFYIKSADKKRDIARYSDKYQMGQHDKWGPDWSRLPKELKIKSRRRVKLKASNVQPKLPGNASTSNPVDITQTLKVLEEKEGQEVEEEEQEETEKKKKEEDGEEQEVDEDYYEEDEMEEETDYNLTYFDGGDNYGADEEDDLDDGPTY